MWTLYCLNIFFTKHLVCFCLAKNIPRQNKRFLESWESWYSWKLKNIKKVWSIKFLLSLYVILFGNFCLKMIISKFIIIWALKQPPRRFSMYLSWETLLIQSTAFKSRIHKCIMSLHVILVLVYLWNYFTCCTWWHQNVHIIVEHKTVTYYTRA